MEFTAQENKVIALTILTKEDGTTRTFPTNEQVTALEIFKKVKPFLTDDNRVLEGSFDLSIEEKAMLLKLIDRPFDVQILESVLSLKSKLS